MSDDDVEVIDQEFNQDYYNDLIIRNGLYSSDIIKAIEIVGKYIKREKLLLVGGMAIDLALKRKGSGIYTDSVLPDHDFYSPRNFIDAYEIGQWLYRTKFPDISIINALHPSTKKVRVHFETVADVTYMPPNIFEVVPFLMINGYKVVHPNYQLIAQHISLSTPFENPPLETIKSPRWKKDMERHDLIYKYYPLHIPKEQFAGNPASRKIGTKQLKGRDFCWSGLAALNYWIREANKEGFEHSRDLGKFDSDSVHLRGKIAIYTDDILSFYELFKKDKKKFYNRQMDHLRRRFETEDFEVYDMKGYHIAASDEGDFYVTNIQGIMVYFLTKLFINKSTNQDFFYGYLVCRDLIKWASNKYFIQKSEKPLFLKLLPTVEIYGKYNVAEPYLIATDPNRAKLTPKDMFSYSFRNMSIPEEFRLFSYDSSWVFDFDGLECADFLKK